MSYLGIPGGADHLVNYEVFGTSSYSCCLDVLCFLGSDVGVKSGSISFGLEPSSAILKPSWGYVEYLKAIMGLS